MSKGERSYHQWCPVAAGLDLIGDRWVLLVCRELAIGDRRFTDLRNALSGIAPNLLSERLRSLVDAGLVTTAQLPPPAARTVYRLTDEGRHVLPVLGAVARFGARHLEGEPTGAGFDARRAAHALLLPWRTSVEVDVRARLDVACGAPADVVCRGTSAHVRAADDQVPDVTMRVTPGELARARRQGDAAAATFAGSASARRAFLAAFDLRVARA